jgi:hypothetical protein
MFQRTCLLAASILLATTAGQADAGLASIPLGLFSSPCEGMAGQTAPGYAIPRWVTLRAEGARQVLADGSLRVTAGRAKLTTDAGLSVCLDAREGTLIVRSMPDGIEIVQRHAGTVLTTVRVRPHRMVVQPSDQTAPWKATIHDDGVLELTTAIETLDPTLHDRLLVDGAVFGSIAGYANQEVSYLGAGFSVEIAGDVEAEDLEPDGPSVTYFRGSWVE